MLKKKKAKVVKVDKVVVPAPATPKRVGGDTFYGGLGGRG